MVTAVRIRCLLAASAIATIGQSEAHAQQATLDKVVLAWEKRQSQIRNVQIQSNGDYLIPKGSISQSLPPFLSKRFALAASEQLPPNDHRFNARQTVTMAENKYRWEVHGTSVWSMDEKAFASEDRVTTFDGKTARSTAIRSTRSYAQGQIQSRDRPVDASVVALYPLATAFRPLQPQLRSFDIREFSVGATAIIGGRECIELTKRLPSQDLLTSVWLDPASEYAMRRMQIQSKGVLRDDIEVEYRQDKEIGSVPTFWRISNYDSAGNLFRSEHHIVSSCRINEDLNGRIFTLDFQPRTYVVDTDHNKYLIVKNDGSTRTLEKEDSGKSFDQLAKSSSGIWLKVLFGISLVILIGSVMLFVWRHRSRQWTNDSNE